MKKPFILFSLFISALFYQCSDEKTSVSEKEAGISGNIGQEESSNADYAICIWEKGCFKGKS